jgi:hypothetical protein
MKVERKFYISAILLFTLALFGCARGWKPVRQDAGLSLLVDSSSIEKKDQMIKARVKAQKPGQNYYTVTTYQIQCGNRTYRPVERLFYERNGILTGQDSNEVMNMPFIPVMQGSNDGIEAIFNYLCR